MTKSLGHPTTGSIVGSVSTLSQFWTMWHTRKNGHAVDLMMKLEDWFCAGLNKHEVSINLVLWLIKSSIDLLSEISASYRSASQISFAGTILNQIGSLPT